MYTVGIWLRGQHATRGLFTTIGDALGTIEDATEHMSTEYQVVAIPDKVAYAIHDARGERCGSVGIIPLT